MAFHRSDELRSQTPLTPDTVPNTRVPPAVLVPVEFFLRDFVVLEVFLKILDRKFILLGVNQLDRFLPGHVAIPYLVAAVVVRPPITVLEKLEPYIYLAKFLVYVVVRQDVA